MNKFKNDFGKFEKVFIFLDKLADRSMLLKC
jgi:hypothetical protein